MSDSTEWQTVVNHRHSNRYSTAVEPDQKIPSSRFNTAKSNQQQDDHTSNTPYKPALQNSLRKPRSSNRVQPGRPSISIRSFEELHEVLIDVILSIPGQVTLSTLAQKFDEYTNKSYKKQYKAEYGSLLDVCYNDDKLLVIPHSTRENEYIIRMRHGDQQYTQEQLQHHQNRVQLQNHKSSVSAPSSNIQSKSHTSHSQPSPPKHTVQFDNSTNIQSSDSNMSITSILTRFIQFGISMSAITLIYILALSSLNNQSVHSTADELMNDIIQQFTNNDNIIGKIFL